MENNVVFLTQKCLYLRMSPFFLLARNAQVTFAVKSQIKINSLNKQKHAFLIRKGFVNRTLPALHVKGHFKITHTVPLIFAGQDLRYFRL